MKKFFRRLPWLLAVLAAGSARADMPPDLAEAVRHLQAQDSYSWEVINGDPGLVAQDIETRHGTVRTLQQSTAPHIVGRLTSKGEMLLQRDWSDGLQLDTFVAAGGTMVTRTPEGWMTTQEILTALAEERVDNDQPTFRAGWLKRADRPSIRRPDQELASLLRNNFTFEPAEDGYVGRLTVAAEGSTKDDPADAKPALDVTITLHLSRGVLRTYELKYEGTRSTTRAHIQVPVSEDRLVVLTYLPVTKLDVPPEAREKLTTSK